MDIGIDLGTTFSVIAVKGKVDLAPGYEGAEYLEEIDVTILPSATGNLTIPSVMWWHPDEPDKYVFGDEAKQMAEEGKSPIMFSKRKIGTNEKLMLNGRAFTAKEVAMHFLRHMKEWAEEVTGQQVDRVVVTHPAYFTPSQVEETFEAAKDAELNITKKQLMMEPCAAALAYTINDTRDPLRVMSYDLGGGTFDVAVMEKIQGHVEMRKFHGDPLLGGYNFDDALVQWILDELKAKGKVIPYDENNEQHKGRRARMLQVAEAVKVRLAEQKTNKVTVPVQVDFLEDDKGNRVQYRGKINREQYAALIQDDLQKTIQCCFSALEGAKMEVKNLHAILLVGGSSHGKWVADVVAKTFGEVVGEPYYPDECVAAGAALCAAQITGGEAKKDEDNRIVLSPDYQPQSVVPNVTVAGSIHPTPGSDLTPDACRRLQVQLITPDGSQMGPAVISDEGRFVFEQVAISEDGLPTCFQLTVSENGKELLSEEVKIVYVEENPPPPPPTPVLPRPLFVKAGRMIAIADEGVKLPAKCKFRLVRNFSGPTLPISIYMEQEEIGTILVEDIPDVAGAGCIVVVDVEITQDNDMRGKVLVYGPNGKTVVKEGPVRIVFPPVVIPELAELLGRFDELKDRLEQEILLAPAQDRARLAGPGRTLVRRIKRITEGQSPDRQVLFEKIKELNRIVNPPPDDMDPPRRDFDNLLAECRQMIAAEPERLKAYTSQVDRVETKGKDAYDTKNNKKWATVNRTLVRIRTKLEQPDEITERQHKPTTTEIKYQANQEIKGLKHALNAAREERMRRKNPESWMPHCDECERIIDQMATGIMNIKDDAPDEQASAQYRQCFITADELRKKIADIHAGNWLKGGIVEKPE